MKRNNLLSRYDAVIVGSGIAGMLLALELDAGGMRCALVCKGRLFDSNTSFAQGGIAICTGANPFDDTEQHLIDTLNCGAGLCDPHIAREIIESGRSLFANLQALGLSFDRQENNSLALAREGGHSQPRVLHSKDTTGKAISTVLADALYSPKRKRIAVFEEMFAVDLIVNNGRCSGLRVISAGELLEIFSPRVILATGGLGRLFSRSTNPDIASGDGIAMAFRAGASLADMEFVQFHPTALCLEGCPATLITEAVRGSGAQLLDRYGERFAFRFHKDGELATRDVVSRAIHTVMKEQESPCVQLDLRPLGEEKIRSAYPNVLASCLRAGINPLKESIPVAPAAHYFMGGIYTDGSGRSTLPGLYAIGECASSGLHGANRLASNSLLEGGVMAMKLARTILGEASLQIPVSCLNRHRIYSARRVFSPKKIDLFRKVIFDNAGLVRSTGSLLYILDNFAAEEAVPLSFEKKQIEAANLGLLGILLSQAALVREESRGAHYRSDFPYTDERFCRRIFMRSDSGLLAHLAISASSFLRDSSFASASSTSLAPFWS